MPGRDDDMTVSKRIVGWVPTTYLILSKQPLSYLPDQTLVPTTRLIKRLLSLRCIGPWLYVHTQLPTISSVTRN